MISLLSFVQTGQLGPVALGTPRNEVVQAFGPPNDWWASSPDAQNSPLWKYANIELHFDASDAVFLIFCKDFKVPPVAPFAFDVSELGNRTEADIESWLHLHQISFQKLPCYWSDDITIFRAASDVELKSYTDDSISTNGSNIARLCSVSRIAR